MKTSVISDSPISDYFIVAPKMNQKDVELFCKNILKDNIVNKKTEPSALPMDFILESISRNLLQTYRSFEQYFLKLGNLSRSIDSVVSDIDLYPTIIQKKVKLSVFVTNPNMKVYKLGLYNPLLVTHDTMFNFASYFNNMSTYLQMQFLTEYLDRVGLFFITAQNQVIFNTLGNVLSMGFPSVVLKRDGDKILEVRYDDKVMLKTDTPFYTKWYDKFVNSIKNIWAALAGIPVNYHYERVVKEPEFEKRKDYYSKEKNVIDESANTEEVNFVGNAQEFYKTMAGIAFDDWISNQTNGFLGRGTFGWLMNNIGVGFEDAPASSGGVGKAEAPKKHHHNLRGTDRIQDTTIGQDKAMFFLALHAIMRHIFGYGTERVYIGDKVLLDNSIEGGMVNDVRKIGTELLKLAFIDGMTEQNEYRVNLTTYFLIFPQYSNYRYMYGSVSNNILETLKTVGSTVRENAYLLRLYWNSILADMYASTSRLNQLIKSYIAHATGTAALVVDKLKEDLNNRQVIGAEYLTEIPKVFDNITKRMFYLGLGLTSSLKHDFAAFLSRIVYNKFLTQYNSYSRYYGFETLANLRDCMESMIAGSKDKNTSPLSAYFYEICNIGDFYAKELPLLSGADYSSDKYIISRLLSDQLISIKYLDKREENTYIPKESKGNLCDFIISIYNSNFNIETEYKRSYYRLLKLLSTYKLQKVFWESLNENGRKLFRYLCPRFFRKKDMGDDEI